MSEHLLCLGEFIAVLQIQRAVLGRGRLPVPAAYALALLLWFAMQAVWGDYTFYSAKAILLNAARFFIASLLFGGKLSRKLFSIVLSAVFVLSYEDLVVAISTIRKNMLPAQVYWTASSFFWYVVVQNVLAFCVVHLMQNYVRKLHRHQNILSTVYLCAIALLDLAFAYYYYGIAAGPYNLLTALISIGLLAATAIYLALLVVFGIEAMQADRAASQVKAEQERAAALMESYQTQRRLTHEFKNHIDALDFYLSGRDVEGARAYLAGISRKIEAGTSVVNTHNPLLDSLLSKGYRSAAEKGVEVHFDLCDLSGFPLEGADLVTVLCNLLDNAVAAAAAADPARIVIRTRRSDRGYIVSFRNSVPRSLEWKDGELPPSTKREPGHGMGLRNVAAAIERCGGEYAISCKDNWFTFTFAVGTERPDIPRRLS